MKNQNQKNTLLSLFTVLLVTVLITGCGSKESGEVSGDSKKTETTTEKKSEKTESSEMNDMSGKEGTEHIMVKLPSMQCGTCKKNIETAVKKLDGIESINVDKTEKVAHINYDKNKVDLAKIETAITSAGYNANDKKADPEAYSKLDDCCKLPEDQKQ